MKINSHGVKAEGPWQVAIPIFVILSVGYLLLIHWSWNTLAAGVFGAPSLTVWETVAGCVLLAVVRGTITTKKGDD